jgi:hypothetical protein
VQTPKTIEFAPTVWKTDITKRESMIDDLLENNYLIGLDYEQMVKFLGESHAVIYRDPLYCAYFVREAYMDPELLYIQFDDAGVIISVKLRIG